VSFPAYPVYKDSEVAWLGEVPSHWDVSPVKVIATFNDEVLTEATDPELEIEYIEISDVEETHGVKGATALTFGDAPSRARRIARAGDILVSTVRTYLRAIAPVPANLDGAIASTGFCVIRGRSADSDFLGYALRSEAFVAEVIARSVGVSYPAINASDLVAIQVPLPTDLEQTAIAAFLDRETAKIDGLVAEQERLIALLKEKRQAVISHAVTKGLNPNAPMKDSGIEWLGEIPAHWGVGPVKRYARVLPGFAFSAADFSLDSNNWRLLRGINVSPQGLRWNEETVYWERNENDGFDGWELAEGDVVIGMDRPWIGDGIRATMVTADDLPCLLLQRVASLRAKDGLDSRFLLRCFQHDAFYHHCAPELTGVSVPHLSGGQIEEFRIPLPPRDEARAICEYVDQKVSEFEALTIEAQSAVTLLQERRGALISAAVTGKIDVRGVASQSNVVSIDSVRPAKSLPSLRAVIGGLVIPKLGDKGRMAVMKGGYLAEAHCGMNDIGGRYQRYAAGPYDGGLIDAMERGADDLCGIKTVLPAEDGDRVTYQIPQSAPPLRVELEVLVGEDKANVFSKMLSDLNGIGREGIEAVATIYAVWNDLIAAGSTADDDAICNGVLNDWHEEKRQKFKRSDLDHWLAWMRRNGFVPNGTAPRTDHQGSLFG